MSELGNLFLLFRTEEEGPNRFCVHGRRAELLRQGLGREVSRRLHVGVLDGPRGTATVVARTSDSVTLEATLEAETSPRPKAVLLLALPRPKVLKRLLPVLAALGLDELVLFRSWRVERTSLESELLEEDAYRPLLHAGLMQACLTHEPRVRIEPRFRPFVEDQLPREHREALRVLTHPRARASFADLGRIPPTGRGVVVVGPERGFLDEEVAAFERARFVPARLGEGILRVETACVAALSKIALLGERAAKDL